MAQRPGALRPQGKGKAKSKDAKGTKAKMADASRPRKPLAAQKPQAAGKTTKPIVAQADDKKIADGKARAAAKNETAKKDVAKNDAKSPTKKLGERKPLVALRPGQKPPAAKVAKRRQPQPIQDGTARLFGRRRGRPDQIRRSANSADGLAASEEQPLLCPGLRQPRVGQLTSTSASSIRPTI